MSGLCNMLTPLLILDKTGVNTCIFYKFLNIVDSEVLNVNRINHFNCQNLFRVFSFKR